MKKRKIRKVKINNFLFVICLILFGCILGKGIINYKINKNISDIDKILQTKSYVYLSDAAKSYVKDVYEETGELILTEKNKEENKPYLNPAYANYISLSDEEKEKIELIPDTYVLDYVPTQTSTDYNLPDSFDLRNQNGFNFLSPIKNQGSTNICWAFAAVENIETLYMKNNNQSYSDLVPKFSIRQMDYITSTSYDSSNSHSYLALTGNWSTGMCSSSSCSWEIWENPDNGSRELNKGGNFYTASIAMANGITLVDDSVMPWHEEKTPVYIDAIYGYDKSLFEVNSTINMPTINADVAEVEVINSYVNEIKTYMMEYGGPFVGTYSPQSTCGFENTDGKKVLKTDDCVNDSVNDDLGHAMQIIGWDDNYEYSYCDNGTKHYSVDDEGGCDKGTLTTGKGAWIIRNSWGTETTEAQEYSYVYLTYDSTRLSVGFTTSMSKMDERSWDNNYHGNPWIERTLSKGMLSVNAQTKEFNTHNKDAEKIEKIKVLTSTKNSKYNISILTKNNNYNNIATIETKENGIYTVELSNLNIVIDDDIFSVKIEGENGAQIFNDSISVFTSNVNDEPSISVFGLTSYEEPNGVLSDENVPFISSYNSWGTSMDVYFKGILDYKKISYNVLLDGVKYNNYFFESQTEKNVFYGDHIKFSFRAAGEEWMDIRLCGKTFTFQFLYDGEVIESFPLKRICNKYNSEQWVYTTSQIKFHKNDGSGYVYNITKNDTTSFKIMNSDGTGELVLGNEEKFFLYDRYIKSWNTEADGSGETYIDNEFFVYKDVDLYAQWSDPIVDPNKYVVEWDSIGEKTYEYNKEFQFPIVNPVSDGKEFIYWVIGDNIFYEEEKFINLASGKSPYKGENILRVTAVKSDSYNSIRFDSNSGSGSMKGINVIKDETVRLKYNLFEKTGYTFVGWNTKADGSGIYYSDGQDISLDSDVTLYAQWLENKIKVTFNANDGTDAILVQYVPKLISTKLLENTFTRLNYKFISWNTKTDGSGISYTDEITTDEDVVLYAMWAWAPITYKVVFDANGGTGTMSEQKFTYDFTGLLNANTFTRENYTFVGWNTKADGSGISYSDKQMVKNLSSTKDDVITLYATWKEVPSISIDEYVVDETNKFIYLTGSNTTLEAFKSHINIRDTYRIELDLSGKTYIFTGSKTKIYDGDELIFEYINIVKGDVTSDGLVNIADVIKVADHSIKGNILVNDYEIKAVDVTGDGLVNIADVIKIADFSLNIINSL